MEKMLAALDKTPTDPEELEKDLLRTSGHVPDSVFKGSKAGEAVADEALEADEADVDGFTFEVPELDEPENKEPPKMIKGHELLGDTPVVFQPQNVMTMARAGQALSEVASQADVFIRYKCKKGKCKTCAVNIDGKWVSALRTGLTVRSHEGLGDHEGLIA